MEAVLEKPEIQVTKRGRGRLHKPKPPTRSERAELLRDRLVELIDELVSESFGDLLKPPGRIQIDGKPEEDPKTGGYIGKVKEPLGTYLQRVSVINNYSQRPPFDHATDPIYRRLIRDFIDRAVMPESKIAALSPTVEDQRVQSLDADGIEFSIIDGLQRLYCYGIAILLILRRDQLVGDGIITETVWEYFKEHVKKAGDPKTATRELLQRPMRYEVFWNIDLAGLLHYMVTFNTGQRKMSLPVQLEIMQRPLIQELENKAKVPIWHDLGKVPGQKRSKDYFAASDLVLATKAFITNNAHVTAGHEAERLLEEEAYLENFGDIQDVVKTLRWIATELHPSVMNVYADDRDNRYILSSSSTFLLGLMAACGYVRNRMNMKVLEGALDKLKHEIERPVDDPLNMADYREALSGITASRGKAMRRLVDDTFRRYFLGATLQLDWGDTARSITGN